MPDIPTPGQVAYRAMIALADDTLRCDCDTDERPLCVACDCLFTLVVAAANFAYAWRWTSRGLMPPLTWKPQEHSHA